MAVMSDIRECEERSTKFSFRTCPEGILHSPTVTDSVQAQWTEFAFKLNKIIGEYPGSRMIITDVGKGLTLYIHFPTWLEDPYYPKHVEDPNCDWNLPAEKVREEVIALLSDLAHYMEDTIGSMQGVYVVIETSTQFMLKGELIACEPPETDVEYSSLSEEYVVEVPRIVPR